MMTEFDRPHVRPRRNRKSPAIRSLVQENMLSTNDLIAPFICCEKKGKSRPSNQCQDNFVLVQIYY